jgi:hypothetical protein
MYAFSAEYILRKFPIFFQMEIIYDFDWYPPWGKRGTTEGFLKNLAENPERYAKHLVAMEKHQREIGQPWSKKYQVEDLSVDHDRWRRLMERTGIRRWGVLISDPEYPVDGAGLPIFLDLQDFVKSQYVEAHEIYYFQLRSSVAFVLNHPNDVTDASVKDFTQQHRSVAVIEATKLANFQFRTNRILIPAWLEDLVWELETNLTGKEIELWQRLTIELNQKRQMSVYVSVKNQTLFISLLFKAHLQSLFNAILLIDDVNSLFGASSVGPEAALSILSHLWLFREDFSLMNVPHVHPFSSASFHAAKRWTHYIAIFVVLHELGHIDLAHSKHGLDIEFEADAFALQAMLRLKATDPDNVILAIDHFFNVMGLVETVISARPGPSARENGWGPYLLRYNQLRSRPMFVERINSNVIAGMWKFEESIRYFERLLGQLPPNVIGIITRNPYGN